MGYLDSTSITVDAVLTKKGRQILSRNGSLDINSFTLTDTGVDYTMWNPDHPSGSAYYGEAIENLPMLEASVHAEYSLRNRLITLNQDTIAIPALEASAPGLTAANLLAFEDSDYPNGKVLTITLKGYSATNMGEIYFVMDDPHLFGTNARQRNKLSGTTRTFLREQDMSNATEYVVTQRNTNGDYQATFTPIVQDVTGRQTNIYVVHTATGAYTSIVAQNDVTKLQRQTLSPSNTKGS
tara:strand:- start:426 stop:1142 length:717 start_codon:yes stop_codon:yes gene_type:complete